jgi:hypothetical protein
MADDKPIRIEVLTVEIDGNTVYGVMAVHRHKTGLGFVVHYGDQSQGGSPNDFGASEEEQRNMRVLAQALLDDIASK